MFRIDDPTATQDNLFTQGDPSIGLPATKIIAAWLNAVQEELASVIEGEGETLDKQDSGQLWGVINAMVSAVSNALGTHAGLSGAGTHGATSAATASKIMIRAANGTVKSADGIAADDVATKGQVDAGGSLLQAYIGRTWHDVKASRAANTLYQNTNAYPITVKITFERGQNTSEGSLAAGPDTDTIVIQEIYDILSSSGIVVFRTVSAEIPPGWHYKYTGTGDISIVNWVELY